MKDINDISKKQLVRDIITLQCENNQLSEERESMIDYINRLCAENDFLHSVLRTSGKSTIGIEKVVLNDPYTVVYLDDGQKVTATCKDGDVYSPTAGLMVCILKKLLGKDFIPFLFEFEEAVANGGDECVIVVNKKKKSKIVETEIVDNGKKKAKPAAKSKSVKTTKKTSKKSKDPEPVKSSEEAFSEYKSQFME